jgi:hypothetical protein
MSADSLIEKLILILNREQKLLKGYNADCEKLHKTIVAKNWIELEKTLSYLKKRAESLAAEDNEREMVISLLKDEMKLSEHSSFGLLLSLFPVEEKKVVNDLKREIRHSVMMLKSRINGIGKYTESQTSALKDVLDILIPDQKGKIYNRNGSASNTGSNPMLFSRDF